MIPAGPAASAGPSSSGGGLPAAGWDDVLAAALIGTDRRPLGHLPADDRAADLLDRAAAWTAYRRAGMRPAARPDASPADRAGDEARPTVTHAAGRRLSMLLDGAPGRMDAASREAVLDEWLRLADMRGRRVPPELLPALLDHGRRRLELRPAIAAVGGARAAWLATLNPQWTYVLGLGSTTDDPAAADADREAWHDGSHGERLAYLRATRRHEPGRARELLEAEWPSLTPDERGDLLATLADRLGPDDEPLLERALDDRRKDVRGGALHLLAALPSSAFNARAAARGVGCVEMTPDGVSVSPPAECDRSMRRDGILAKPPAGTGERGWWLEEVLARAPLSTWGLPATEFMARPVLDDEWTPTVRRGLARAAAARRDPQWAVAALDALGDTSRDRECAISLYPVLEPSELVPRAVTALSQGVTAVWGPMLGSCPAPWPVPLGQAVLSGLSQLAQRANLAGDLYQLCRLAAVRMPAEAAGDARVLLERVAQLGPTGARTGALDAFVSVLSFRHEMTREIA